MPRKDGEISESQLSYLDSSYDVEEKLRVNPTKQRW
jgi:hypothetical protein